MEKKAIKDFQKFVTGEVVPAITDLKKLDECHRIHVQKLVYTNLVDRFDTVVDTTVLDNCREDALVDEASKDLTGTVTESDLLRLLMHADGLQDAIATKLRNGLRNSVLRQRHSKKLQVLMGVLVPDINVWTLPRVNPADGKILEQIKPPNKQQPLSLCGYADWLYSRRNSIVHGGGKGKYLENDKTQLKKLFKCVPPDSIKIKLSSVENAATFYSGMAKIMLWESA
jgi:hypothetical protein